jgi:hypothetical protein
MGGELLFDFYRYAKAISQYPLRLLATLLMSPHRALTAHLGCGSYREYCCIELPRVKRNCFV